MALSGLVLAHVCMLTVRKHREQAEKLPEVGEPRSEPEKRKLELGYLALLALGARSIKDHRDHILDVLLRVQR